MRRLFEIGGFLILAVGGALRRPEPAAETAPAPVTSG
jgi:hypothetical protein